MNFQKLLYRLSEREGEFTSGQVASHLGKQTKEVSKDLRRLHQMGFIKRKRKKRLCLTRNSKLCNKGFEYLYSLSKQGRSYVKWMDGQKLVEDLAYIQLYKEILDHLPEGVKHKLRGYVAISSSYAYKGPSRRFRLFGYEFFLIANSFSEREKAIEEKAAREKKILQESIRSYEEQVNSYRKRIQQQEREANARENTLKTISTLWTFDKKAVDVLSKAITILSKSRDFLAHILAFSVPKERYIKILDHVSELENKKWTEVKKEIDAMRAHTTVEKAMDAIKPQASPPLAQTHASEAK